MSGGSLRVYKGFGDQARESIDNNTDGGFTAYGAYFPASP